MRGEQEYRQVVVVPTCNNRTLLMWFSHLLYRLILVTSKFTILLLNLVLFNYVSYLKYTYSFRNKTSKKYVATMDEMVPAVPPARRLTLQAPRNQSLISIMLWRRMSGCRPPGYRYVAVPGGVCLEVQNQGVQLVMDKFIRNSPDGTTLILPLFSILFLQNRKVLIASKYF